MRDTQRSFAKMAMAALLQRETLHIDPKWIATTAWAIAAEMESIASQLDEMDLDKMKHK